MRKDNKVFIRHILDSIVLIEKYVKGLTEEDFSRSRSVQDAVVRRFEIIGEASNNLSKEFRAKNKSIEWLKIIGMRNMLIHEYFDMDLKIIWDTIKKDLPILKKGIKKII